MINDCRDYNEFKKITFSGYKKSDVIHTLFKNIESKNMESACNWLIECIISGYIKEIWEKLCLYYSKSVHINNVSMIEYTYSKNIIMKKFMNNKTNNELLMLRNEQTIINIMITYILLLISSTLNIKYANIKIKKEDFILNNLQLKLNAHMNILPENIVNINEPPELQLIANEILFNLHSKLNCYDKTVYWIYWILEWEKINIKNKIKWNINSREVNVKDKYKNDIIWMIWDIIKIETKHKNKYIQNCINYLYKLYIEDYDKNKRIKRIPYIMNCIGLLSSNIKENNICKNIIPIIQAQCNYHIIIETKKIHEKKGIIQEVIKENKSQNKVKTEIKIEDEKIKDKLNDFNEIDKLLFL